MYVPPFCLNHSLYCHCHTIHSCGYAMPVTHTRTRTRPFNGPLSGTTRVSWYQKGKTNLDFTEARDSEWQWNPLGHMQVCTSLQTDNNASTPPLSFFTGRMPFLSPNQQCQSTEGKMLCLSMHTYTSTASDELPSANALSALQHHLSGTLSLSLFRTVTRSHYSNLDLKHICSPPSLLLN